MPQDSILYFLPDDEFDFFHLFRMETILYASLGKDTYKHNITVLKWYDLVGFVIKGKNNKDIHIVAMNWDEDKIRFKLWETDDVIKVGGIVDRKGNFVELFKEYEYGNPLPLNKTDPQYKIMERPEVQHTLPLVDMIYLFQNIKRGIRIDSGMLGDTLTQIFNVKLREGTRAVANGIIPERVNYYLYYDDSIRLVGIERRNEKGANLLLKINKRSTYLLDKDIIILRDIEHNH